MSVGEIEVNRTAEMCRALRVAEDAGQVLQDNSCNVVGHGGEWQAATWSLLLHGCAICTAPFR